MASNEPVFQYDSLNVDGFRGGLAGGPLTPPLEMSPPTQSSESENREHSRFSGQSKPKDFMTCSQPERAFSHKDLQGGRA